MQNNETANTAFDLTELSNELAYQRYRMNRNQLRRFFRELSMPEYIALHIIARTGEMMDSHSGRTYLKDVAEEMQMPIRQTSKMMGALKERGLVLWSHDGSGDEGTYVTITDSGKKLLAEEEARLKEYYGKVIGKFGRDNLVQLLGLMRQLETVMSEEITGKERSDEQAGE